jgi:hypothetical protein
MKIYVTQHCMTSVSEIIWKCFATQIYRTRTKYVNGIEPCETYRNFHTQISLSIKYKNNVKIWEIFLTVAERVRNVEKEVTQNL